MIETPKVTQFSTPQERLVIRFLSGDGKPRLHDFEDIKRGWVFQLVPIDDADAKSGGSFDKFVAICDAYIGDGKRWTVKADRVGPAESRC